jgi:hypothetical protein
MTIFEDSVVGFKISDIMKIRKKLDTYAITDIDLFLKCFDEEKLKEIAITELERNIRIAKEELKKLKDK